MNYILKNVQENYINRIRTMYDELDEDSRAQLKANLDYYKRVGIIKNGRDFAQTWREEVEFLWLEQERAADRRRSYAVTE